MGIVDRLFTSVSGFYKDINPSNLSGAADIIVIEDEHGGMRCSPFYVRFGKMHMFRLTSRTVNIVVNKTMSNICMKIGSQGELYFERDDLDGDECCLISDEAKFEIKTSDEYLREEENEWRSASDSEVISQFMCRIKKHEWKKDPFRGDESNTAGLESIIYSSDDKAKMSSLYPRRLIDYTRAENYTKRLFAKTYFKFNEDDYYYALEPRFKYFAHLIDSLDHFEFLAKKHGLLFHLICGLIFPSISKGENKCDLQGDNGCPQARLSFSLCSGQKTKRGLDEAFDSCLVRDIEKTSNLIAKLEGCKKCGARFFLRYDFFTELFFYLRNQFFTGVKAKKKRNFPNI
jgi:phosphatidate phosphatase PAH1